MFCPVTRHICAHACASPDTLHHLRSLMIVPRLFVSHYLPPHVSAVPTPDVTACFPYQRGSEEEEGERRERRGSDSGREVEGEGGRDGDGAVAAASAAVCSHVVAERQSWWEPSRACQMPLQSVGCTQAAQPASHSFVCVSSLSRLAALVRRRARTLDLKLAVSVLTKRLLLV